MLVLDCNTVTKLLNLIELIEVKAGNRIYALLQETLARA